MLTCTYTTVLCLHHYAVLTSLCCIYITRLYSSHYAEPMPPCCTYATMLYFCHYVIPMPSCCTCATMLYLRHYAAADSGSTIDEDKQADDGCRNQDVRVVAQPGKVEAYLLTKVHPERRAELQHQSWKFLPSLPEFTLNSTVVLLLHQKLVSHWFTNAATWCSRGAVL